MNAKMKMKRRLTCGSFVLELNNRTVEVVVPLQKAFAV